MLGIATQLPPTKQFKHTPPPPSSTPQPEGPSFSVDGNTVSWEGWQFHVGFSWREGLILNDIQYNDQGRLRPVMHRAALAEVGAEGAVAAGGKGGRPGRDGMRGGLAWPAAATRRCRPPACPPAASATFSVSLHLRRPSKSCPLPPCSLPAQIIVPYGEGRDPFQYKCAYDICGEYKRHTNIGRRPTLLCGAKRGEHPRAAEQRTACGAFLCAALSSSAGTA